MLNNGFAAIKGRKREMREYESKRSWDTYKNCTVIHSTKIEKNSMAFDSFDQLHDVFSKEYTLVNTCK